MNEPKYQIGELISLSQLVVRGIAPQKSGNYLYFVQIVESDNCFVGSEDDLNNATYQGELKIADLAALKKNWTNYRYNYSPPCPICRLQFCACG